MQLFWLICISILLIAGFVIYIRRRKRHKECNNHESGNINGENKNGEDNGEGNGEDNEESRNSVQPNRGSGIFNFYNLFKRDKQTTSSS
jgi:hypothetical protein